MKYAKVMVALCLLALAGAGLWFAGCSKNGSIQPGGGSSGRLNGGGSSFVNPMMQEWASLYEKEKGIRVNYQSIGSGAGIGKMTSQEFDFGCTDAPMNEEQLAKAKAQGGEVIHIPLVMGAVVPAYNLPELQKPLRFSGPVLADIYLGKIKKWNDPALAKLNPGVALPDRDISVTFRAETSGTTYIWVDFLAKVSPEWKEKVGVGTSVQWPAGGGQKNSEGVSGYIERTPGAIGYIELLYALDKKGVQYGSVQNKEGEFVLGDLDSVTAAAKNALTDIPDDLRYSLTNPAGKESYPISGTTWAVLYVNQPAGKGTAVVDFIRWITSPAAQDKTSKLKYACLPEGLIERIEKKLALVK
jgi:phosphate transport system substrate-binding protein